jgi:uncharacterized protein (TIGR03086 family)
MDLNTLYHRTVEGWATRVNAVADDQWDDPTPCADWTVRDLVNHVVGEDRWTLPLTAGSTIEEVGSSLDGDLLGADPVSASLDAATDAVAAVAARLPRGGTVHLSYGEEHVEEYIRQLAADHLIHSWDLARATGGDSRLDPALVSEVARWFADREELYRSAGVVGPRAPSTGNPQGDLLAGFGRRADWGTNDAVLARFSRAFGAGDVDAVMALMTEDCVFEATSPAPDGRRLEGATAVASLWRDMFATTPDARFTEEEAFVCGDRGVLRWRFSWTDDGGAPGHVRGVDVLRFRDGKVAEKLSYVKG